MSWSGNLTELNDSFAMTEYHYELDGISVRDDSIGFGWREDSGRYEVLLKKKSLNGIDVWSGSLERAVVGDVGELCVTLYELKDSGTVMIGRWIFGEDTGLYLVELLSDGSAIE